MQGKRIADGANRDAEPGSYWRHPRGRHGYTQRGVDWEWACKTPNDLLGWLAKHDVEEHEDGTITVTPSILVNRPPDQQWHGFLTRGVWSSV